MNKVVQYYSCKRQTKRWPMVFRYNMLDVAVMNAYTLFIDVHTEYMNDVNQKRRLFLKELVKELVMLHMACVRNNRRLKGMSKRQRPSAG